MTARPSRALLVALLAVPCWAGPLEDAQSQVKEIKYPLASKTLKRVAAERDLGREQVLRFYELSGIVAASLGDAKSARESFSRLLRLAPDFVLKGRFAPKVTTPFFEAKANAKEQGPLTLTLERGRVEGDVVTELVLNRSGGEGWVTSVAVQLEEDGVTREVAVTGAGTQLVTVRGRRVTASAVAREAQGWVLAQTGSQTFESPQARPAAPRAPSADLVPPPLPPAAAVEAASSEPRFRGLAVGFAVAGGVALATGAICGGLTLDFRGRFQKAAVNSQGLVTGLSREEAVALETQARQTALIANIGFIAGGALAVAAGVTWFVGNPVQPRVAILPGEGVVFAVGGSLP